MPGTSSRRAPRRFGVALAASGLVAGSLVAPTAAGAAEKAPSIAWDGPCDYAKKLQCGTMRVPLDYAKPGGKKLTLHVERHRATDPAADGPKSIFVNPGGPGGSGQKFSASVAERLGSKVAAKYDIISFDPRGIGSSVPLQCFADDAGYEKVWGNVEDVAITKGQMSDSLDAAQRESAACKRRAKPLLKEMSTKNVARDLDRLRRAVGDDELSYAGYSYGTMLGATYANMFPDRVGRMILDGPVDPKARANDRVENKRARAEGFEHALDGFLAECKKAGKDKCAFAAGDGTPRSKFTKIRETLRKGPVQASPSEQVTLSAVTGSASGAMYGREDFVELAKGLQELYQVMFADDKPTLRSGKLRLLQANTPDPRYDQAPGSKRASDAEYGYNGSDSLFAVNCADTRMPRSRAAYPRIAKSYEKTARTFGRSEAFSEAACGSWPKVQDHHAGPWDRQTANPLLVVGQTYDPATPYSMAKRMADQLGDARLLTIDGFGHCSQDSKCAQQKTAKYMLTGKLPKPGERCDQDLGPFDPAP